jgi:hypothetical protein
MHLSNLSSALGASQATNAAMATIPMMNEAIVIQTAYRSQKDGEKSARCDTGPMIAYAVEQVKHAERAWRGATAAAGGTPPYAR